VRHQRRLRSRAQPLFHLVDHEGGGCLSLQRKDKRGEPDACVETLFDNVGWSVIDFLRSASAAVVDASGLKNVSGSGNLGMPGPPLEKLGQTGRIGSAHVD
jgi:hypothetical protein